MEAIARAIQERRLDASIEIVVSSNPNAEGLKRAEFLGIKTRVFEQNAFPSKIEYENAIIQTLHEHNVGLVLLAGYMKILGVELIQAFRHHVMNIHPSLLPAFKGLHAQRQAVEYGARYSGCTVHFVTEDLDGGPIILQDTVEVSPEDTEKSLSDKILEKEHVLYPRAVQLFAENRLKIENKRVVIL